LEPENPEPSKKTYKAPQLKVFGDIRTLTRAVTRTGKHADGGRPPTNKT